MQREDAITQICSSNSVSANPPNRAYRTDQIAGPEALQHSVTDLPITIPYGRRLGVS